MTEEDYRRKQQNVISLFPDDFKEMIQTNAWAHKTFHYLVKDGDPYEIIYQLLKAQEEMQKTINKMSDYIATPAHLLPLQMEKIINNKT
ncbi:hypothetical protein [Flavobacterium beibuense]|uniref:hypothetical protein n=1 Tax=Flavobacterium beibuense TaxID=657326 RepID=UPI003A94B972